MEEESSNQPFILSTACDSISNTKVLYSKIGHYSRINSCIRTLLLAPEHFPFRWNPYNIEESSAASFGERKSEMQQSDPDTKKLWDMLT